ncbi:SRPBCC family protein [Streptomyces sp. NPDC059382]|uniref:SRPBCC family protein n=1 Tax=unclassified Streptomyces TaxID=2593676 RepID=UPI003328B9A2
MTTNNTRPTAIDENAPAVVRLETTIEAPLATVWALHTDIAGWSDWHTGIDRVEFVGPLAAGTRFRWLTHGLDITSTVLDVTPGERIAWGGPAHGIDGVHVWTFHEGVEGVTVRTEESWAGAPVEARPAEMAAALRQSLEEWLHLLKTTAEAR